MAEVMLGTPHRWTEQLRLVHLDELVLSYYPKTWPQYPSPDEVAGDLHAGVWLRRERTPNAPFFRIGGARFALKLKRRRGDGNGNSPGPWMAQVLEVTEAEPVPRRISIKPAVVVFAKLWEEAPCDLVEILELVRQREREIRVVRQQGTRHQPEVRAHKRLQDQVRRQYGELETLVAVLEQRPEPPEETVIGRVVPGEIRSWRREPSLVVDIEEGTGAPFRGKRVQIRQPDGARFNTRVTFAGRRQLEIAAPRGWAAEPDAEVHVSVVRPFGMRQDAEALTRFKAQDLEGSWDNLARLLCRPADLRLPDRAPALPAYYCDDDPRAANLNDEQRAAVAGAVTTPHAFLIQGPPGTGKTEVITEIIRQLVGRGERVLLLAPNHVAVDEALGRVGHKPGVRPLRITWDDGQVHERLRVYLPEQVGVELAHQVLSPTDHGQVARWLRERDSVNARLAALARLREVTDQREVTRATLSAAERAAGEARQRLESHGRAAEQETAAIRGTLAELDRARDTTRTAVRAAQTGEERERTTVSPTLTALRTAAAELVAASSALAGATRQAEAIGAERTKWQRHHEGRVAALSHEWRAAEQGVANAHHQFSLADQAVAAQRELLAQAVHRQSAAGRFGERLGLGPVARARRQVAHAEGIAWDWRAEWARWDATRQEVARRHAELRQAGHQAAADWERQHWSAQAACETATRRSNASVKDFSVALVAAGGAADRLGIDSGQEWAGVAGAVNDGLTAFLPDPAAAPPPLPDLPGMRPVTEALARWHRAVTHRQALERQLAGVERRHSSQEQQLWRVERDAVQELARLTAERERLAGTVADSRAALASLTAERDRLRNEAGFQDPAVGEPLLRRRRHVLERLPDLDVRWRELAAERSDHQLVEDIQHSLLRATNLVCATTKGIVGRGSNLVRDIDYDTLIVDEASRVTESEFLIGAIRARRWVLVGDERQLPPFVDQDDEHFLHALTALHRAGRGGAGTLDQAVEDLAGVWAEDEKERKFRTDSVLELAQSLDRSGQWESTFGDQFTRAHLKFTAEIGDDDAVDRRILQAMRRYLVQSLFEQVVRRCDLSLRQPLLVQRRMIAPLARIVSEPIYNGRYWSPTDEQLAEVGVTPLVVPDTFDHPATFLDTSHYDDAGEKQVRHGFVNEREQEFVVRACQLYDAQLQSPVTASVLSFYLAQARALQERLRGLRLPMLQWEVIDVIDRIQGQQSDLVLISFTRARAGRPGRVGERYGQWLQDLRRLNVACTRARRAVVFVGHGRTLSQLRTTEAAKDFYRNLLGLFDSDRGNFKRVHQLRQFDWPGSPG